MCEFFKVKQTGNEVFCTDSSIWLVKNVMCSQLQCQNGLNLNPFSYKIWGRVVRAFRGAGPGTSDEAGRGQEGEGPPNPKGGTHVTVRASCWPLVSGESLWNAKSCCFFDRKTKLDKKQWIVFQTSTSHRKSQIPNPKSKTPNPKLQRPNPQPWALNPKHQNLNPEPWTQSPNSKFRIPTLHRQT